MTKIDMKKEVFDLIKKGCDIGTFTKYYNKYHENYCDYSIPWVGACGRDKDESRLSVISVKYGEGVSYLCEEHSKAKCMCGKPAIRGCSHAGSFVCGRPLCSLCSCEH